MKRLFGIVLFFCVIAGCITSVANEKDNAAGQSLNHKWGLISDTLVRNPFFKVDSFRLDIIPPSSGVQFYKDGIVFLSHSKTEGKMLRNHISFGTTEAYYAVLIDSVLGDRTVFSPTASFVFPCEAITFNSDYTTMYFTKRPDNKGSEKIYQSVRNDKGEWISDSQPLNICTDGSIYTHPSLSANAEIMVFASNRKGSAGGLDLFVTRKEGLKWSYPENIGDLINTDDNELFPFLDSENNLFFSSDGHQGFGGYDIFISRYNGKGWDKPANLTQYINTANDELAFTLNRNDGKTAFFTARQKSGTRILQLFRVTFENQYALKNELTNLSNAFTHIALLDKPSGEKTVAVSTVPVKINPPKTEPIAEAVKREAAKEEVKAVEAPVKKTTVPDKKAISEPVQQVVKTETTIEAVKPSAIETAVTKDVVIYRVQFQANATPKGSYQITINGKDYKTYEYLYSGAYRTSFSVSRKSFVVVSLRRS